jgi:very-short-patch-repair endonuclease
MPEVRARIRAKLKGTIRSEEARIKTLAFWTPTQRKQHAVMMKAIGDAASTEEKKNKVKKNSELAIKNWSNPAYRKLHAAKMQEAWQREEVRVARSVGLTKAWTDKEHRKNYIDGMSGKLQKLNTKPERKTVDYLLSIGHKVIFWNQYGEHQKLFDSFEKGKRWLWGVPVKGLLVDLYQPESKTIIEVDGCYWHGCPICFSKFTDQQTSRQSKDQLKTNRLTVEGFRIFRIWEHDIKKKNFTSLDLIQS